MIIFAFIKVELKEKTQDTNFSMQIKNPNPLLKNRFRIRIPKFAKNWADSGFGSPTLNFSKSFQYIFSTFYWNVDIHCHSF